MTNSQLDHFTTLQSKAGVGMNWNLHGTRYPSVPEIFCLAGTQNFKILMGAGRYPWVPGS